MLKLNNNLNLRNLGKLRQLEYIENTGTEWIDTGLFANRESIGFEITFSLSSTPAYNNPSVIGYGPRNYGNGWGGLYIDNSGGIFAIRQYGSYNRLFGATLNTKYNIKYNTTTNNLIILDNGSIYERGLTGDSYNYDTKFLLFGYSISSPDEELNPVPYNALIKIYGFKLYNNNTLISDFIPVLDHNNVACMYDIISSNLFYNKGTGNFIAGPVVGDYNVNFISNPPRNIDEIFIHNCPRINQYETLKQIYKSQENNIVLGRIRLDIGNVNDSIEELKNFANFSGFNDLCEPQNKPRLVGNFTLKEPTFKKYLQICGFDTSSLSLSQQSTVFDGLTITIPNISYTSPYAVQTLDSTENGYNPWLGLFVDKFNSYFNSVDYIDGGICCKGLSLNGSKVQAVSGWLDSSVFYRGANDYLLIRNNAYAIIEDVDNLIVDNPGQFWPYPNEIDYSGLGIKYAIIIDGKRDTMRYYFPKEFFGIITITPGVGSSGGVMIGAEYHFKGTLSDFFNAENHRYDGSYARNTWTYRIPDLYIDLDNKEIGEYLDTELNQYYFGKTTIDSKFTLTKAHITELPSNCTIIAEHAFQQCENAVFTLPSTVTTIGSGAFFKSGLYGEINLPNLTTLYFDSDYYTQAGPFEYTNITSIKNLGNITTIGRYCFRNCTSLETAVVPTTVTAIRDAAFSGCTSLTYVRLLPTTPPSISTDCFNGTTTNLKIYVGSGSSAENDDSILQSYLADTNWATYSSKLDTWYNYLHPTT